VLLNESHNIKGDSTAISRACLALRSHRRWSVTGTPANTSVDDFKNQVRARAGACASGAEGACRSVAFASP
jgi:hypothetical protein